MWKNHDCRTRGVKQLRPRTFYGSLQGGRLFFGSMGAMRFEVNIYYTYNNLMPGRVEIGAKWKTTTDFRIFLDLRNNNFDIARTNNKILFKDC